MKMRNLLLALAATAVLGAASTADAAVWKRLGGNPFYRPPLTSEADLRAMVQDRAADLKAGFAKAGAADLYDAFAKQFPDAKVTVIKVAPGETFKWMLFKKKTTGRLYVMKDVVWKGAETFEALRFAINKDGKQYEFAVPYACGNFTLKTVGPIPAPAAGAAGSGAGDAAAAAAAAAAAKEAAAKEAAAKEAAAKEAAAKEAAAKEAAAKEAAAKEAAAKEAAAKEAAAKEAAAKAAAAGAGAGTTGAAAAGAGAAGVAGAAGAGSAGAGAAGAGLPGAAAAALKGAGAGAAGAGAAGAGLPGAAAAALKGAGAGAPGAAPAFRSVGGFLADLGVSREPDPANYVFARVGYELPIGNNLSVMALVGGALRWMGNDGGSAFTADGLLDFHNARYSVGAGAGFWSGNDGQLDILVDLGYLVAADQAGRTYQLLFEARLPADNLDESEKFGRYGLGVRTRF